MSGSATHEIEHHKRNVAISQEEVGAFEGVLGGSAANPDEAR